MNIEESLQTVYLFVNSFLVLQIRYWSQLNLTVQNVDNGNKLKYEFTGLKQDTYYFFEVGWSCLD